MLDLNKKAQEKNLKVAVGLMCRHCVVRKELFDRIKNGEMGDINLLRAYRCKGREATCFTEPRDTAKEPSELLFQIKNFHSFLWLSGGSFSDFLIHNIDECCWMKDAWPIAAKGYGGRHYRGNFIDQNFDVYDVEYTFADGAKLMLKGRTMPGCSQEFASYAQGSKGSAVISFSSHSPAKSRIFKTQNITMRSTADVLWQGPKEEPDPYQVEWDDYMAAIRADKPYNEVERGVMASAVTAMGRYSCHTGQDVTLENFMKHEEEFAPGRRQAHARRTVAAAGGFERQVSRAGTGSPQESRIQSDDRAARLVRLPAGEAESLEEFRALGAQHAVVNDERAAALPREFFRRELQFAEPCLGGIGDRRAEDTARELGPMDRAQAHRARFARRVHHAAGQIDRVEIAVAAWRIALTSAWHVGSVSRQTVL